MSQEDLAKKVSMSRQTINYIENGTKTPDFIKAFEIARALQADISALFIQYPAIQDLLDPMNKDELRAMWADLGLDPKIIDEDKVDYDALEKLAGDKALELAKRLNVDYDKIFEFNFEEKKKLALPRAD